MANKLVVDEGNSFIAFVNAAGTNKETSVEEHNKLMLKFIEAYNNGAELSAFKGTNGKIVIGFK